MRCWVALEGWVAHKTRAYSHTAGCNKETQRYSPWASPQDARESVWCQLSGGLASLTYILYEENTTCHSKR